ncbi:MULTISPECIES: DEAD/DEAH box helicase [unclassified Massilia]|uniref:DEAD/DEAH box helicase n=1 Tax=unclassified Massilia TaxID=2609279 RepID=UPI0017809B21|nr:MULTISPECIES: DEAD/DEAH box helicase [unclassified Massilia]MBD8532024.1 DEAD/DEAH box helicase [Massilia sp. CFBP 13647]MBD8675470.1 DEAD/DEAH box helicase [Massilia sp. CFBP 13721]
MSETILSDLIATTADNYKRLLGLLALAGEPMGRTRIFSCLNRIYGAGFNEKASNADIDAMRDAALLAEVTGRGFIIASDAAWPALRAVLETGDLQEIAAAYMAEMPMKVDWQGKPVLRSYRQGVALLRLFLISGKDKSYVAPLLTTVLACHEAAYLHPLVDICARPFQPDLVDRIHPTLIDDVLAILINQVQRDPDAAPVIRTYTEDHVAHGHASMELRVALAEHLILCGRLDDAATLLQDLDDSAALFYRSVLLLLRDHIDEALAGFDAALKQLRRETGRRKQVFAGIGGHLYVAALLRRGDAKHQKAVDSYLDSATRAVQSHDTAVYQQLSMLRQIRGGTVDAEVLPSRNWETALQPIMFRALLHWWLGMPQLSSQRARLEEALAQSESAGFDFISSQLAGILGQLGGVGHEQRAIALRQQGRFTDMTHWFEREQPWERQLNALINLQPAVNVEVVKESRLVWLIRYDEHLGVQELEPREQKRDAQGAWSRGRPMGLKRLTEDAATLDFLTAQDVLAVSNIGASRQYYGSGLRYEFDLGKTLAALIGHPLLFWFDAPGTRVELLPGEPELLVKAAREHVTISLRPPVNEASGDVVVARETPTRLRVVRVRDEHRRIGAIVGEALVVPLEAEVRVLQAIGAISSIVTVQSDIGASAADIEKIAADARLHVHLLPYQHGLRMRILVRPLPNSGAYYAPGSGAERVIADFNGIRTEARRDLNAEREAERQLVGTCRALEAAEEEHGEWLLGQPIACLELVSELQELDPAHVVIAWPEGEPFRVSKKVASESVRVSIKRDKDWFAANGDVIIDESRVMDLRALLDKVRGSEGRFVALGDNQFVALTNELHRRLLDVAAFTDADGEVLRVHPLASFALEELALGAGGVEADKAWRAHIKKMADTAAYVPQLPSTLQAELRDYQREGFDWLARLAHWGVGACLADDMGLGKTLQALALMLLRAPNGPTLVVAPTSVCTNWIAEAARFAPTLNIKLFGPGERAPMIEDAGAFDVIVASYGLLQLEAPLFARKRWHTIVMDEAQSFKNAATRRSQAVMALQGDFKMVATGTPLENHLGELWNLFRFINPGLLGTADQFQLRFAGPIEKAQDKRAESAARARLKRLTQPFILRRTKSQVLTELPPRTEIVLPVELSAEETALYESLRREALDKLAALEAPQSQKSIAILAEMMRLRRACCNPALVAPGLGIPSSKLATFAHLLDGLLENRHKVLVFSQFVDHLSLIRKHLDARGIRYQYLDGSTPMQERKKRVDAFQAGEGDLFLISLKAGGVGINLTAADYVIHMDPWWNPAVEDQASDRAHRMGQQRPVTIYRLVARHTIEEGIVDLHRHKRDLADSLLEGGDLSARMAPNEMLAMLQQGLSG